MLDDNYLKKELYSLVKTDTSIFDFLQNGSLDGIWYWDLENPENEWMSEHFWTVLGYDPNEMSHHASQWQDKINNDDLQVALNNFNKHLQDPEYPYNQIVRYIHKNGSTVWIRCRGIAIRDKNGKAIRMLGAHNNVTELMQAQEELKKLNQSLLEKIDLAISENHRKDAILIEQSKLAQMGEMLNMIAHQWRQPLNAISASAINLSMKNDLHILNEDDIEKSSKFIQEQTQMMSKIINDFMLFNKPEDNIKFSLYRATMQVINMTSPQFKSRDINIDVDIDEEIIVFHNDKNFEHSLLNIIINSRDAFEDIDKIYDKKIKIYTDINEDYINLHIEDNAGGIAENIIDKIFNPYFTTKETDKGTGIGLYMSKEMIENVPNSSLSVKNTKNGARFTIKFTKL